MTHQSWFQNLLADQTPERRAQLEELAELKAERSLTSAEALLDYRIRSGSEELMEYVSAELGKTVAAQPELVVGIADDFAERISYIMNKCVIRKGDFENLGFYVHHIVDCALLKRIQVEHQKVLSADRIYRYWTVDERPFFIHLATHFPDCLDQASISSELLAMAFRHFRTTSSSPILTSSETGSLTSLKEFRANPDNWTLGIDDQESFLKDAVGVRKGAPLTSADQVEFKNILLSARRQTHAERRKALWRWHELSTPRDLALLVYSPDKLYNRATLDMTLGHLWVQRRIAIALVYQLTTYEELHRSDIQETLDTVEARFPPRISYLNNSLSRLYAMEAPEKIVRSTFERLAKQNYFRLAILENRGYLERFFSS